MEDYYLKLKDLVINTMITINVKEKRRVIDNTDINNYKEVLKKLSIESKIQIHFDKSDYENVKYEIKDYILVKDNKFIMLPWLETNDLIGGFRSYLPLDLILLVCNHKIPNMMEDRSIEIKNEYRKIEDVTSDFYSKKIESENLELEKIKQKNIVKLSKIGNISKNYE